MELATVMQMPSGEVLSWLTAAGGVTGLLALVAVGVAIGRFGSRMDSAETAIKDRPTRPEIDGQMKSIGKSLDNLREDVRDVRDFLLNGRRP